MELTETPSEYLLILTAENEYSALRVAGVSNDSEQQIRGLENSCRHPGVPLTVRVAKDVMETGVVARLVEYSDQVIPDVCVWDGDFEFYKRRRELAGVANGMAMKISGLIEIEEIVATPDTRSSL